MQVLSLPFLLSLFLTTTTVFGQTIEKGGSCQQVKGGSSTTNTDFGKQSWANTVRQQVGIQIDADSIEGDDWASGYCIDTYGGDITNENPVTNIGYYYMCTNVTEQQSANCVCAAVVNGQQCASCSICTESAAPATGNVQADCSNIANVGDDCSVDCGSGKPGFNVESSGCNLPDYELPNNTSGGVRVKTFVAMSFMGVVMFIMASM